MARTALSVAAAAVARRVPADGRAAGVDAIVSGELGRRPASVRLGRPDRRKVSAARLTPRDRRRKTASSDNARAVAATSLRPASSAARRDRSARPATRRAPDSTRRPALPSSRRRLAAWPRRRPGSETRCRPSRGPPCPRSSRSGPRTRRPRLSTAAGASARRANAAARGRSRPRSPWRPIYARACSRTTRGPPSMRVVWGPARTGLGSSLSVPEMAPKPMVDAPVDDARVGGLGQRGAAPKLRQRRKS